MNAGRAGAALDEPTSKLNARDEAAQRRTLVVVTHRLSTVVDPDRTVVSGGGHLLAVGNHGELLASGPLHLEPATGQLLVA